MIELTDWVAEAEDLWEGAGPATATTARVAAAYRRRRQQRLGGEEEGGLGSSALAPVGGDGGPSWWWEDGGGYGGGGDGEGDQLPVRIQREVNLLWYELSSGDRMAYLGEEARRRLRQTLVVLAAFRTLFEHPGRALRRQSAQECFRQADVNGDGQVSFAEFLRWFRESQAAASDSGAAATGSALVPFGEGAAARALEGVAMRDLLRRFLTQRGQGEGEEEGGGDGRAAAMGGARSEEQVLEDLDRCVYFVVGFGMYKVSAQ